MNYPIHLNQGYARDNVGLWTEIKPSSIYFQRNSFLFHSLLCCVPFARCSYHFSSGHGCDAFPHMRILPFKWPHTAFVCAPSKCLNTGINNSSYFLCCFLTVQEMAFYYLFPFSTSSVVKLSFSISLENTCTILLCLWRERFREFHLPPVSFLFPVCSSLYICWLFSCLMVPELFWQSPGLGGGSKSWCQGLIAQREGMNTRKGHPAGLSMAAQEELWFSTSLTLQEASVRSFWHSQSEQKYSYAWLLGHKVLYDDKVLFDCRFLRSMKNQTLISSEKSHQTA